MRCVALFAYAVSILVLWIKLCRSQNTDTCFTTSLVLVDADTLNYTRAIGSSVTYSVDSYISTVCRQLTWQFNSVPVVFYRSGSLTYGGDYNSSSLQLVLNATGTNELFHFELTILSLSARENNLNVVVTNAASSDSVATPLIATYCPVDNRTNSYTPTQTTCGFNCVATFQCNNDTFEVTGYAGQNNYTESCQANATLTNDGSCTEISTTSPNDIVVTESKSGSYTNVGAIVGGVIGGVALLGLIGGGVFLYKKHSDKNGKTETDNTTGKPEDGNGENVPMKENDK